MFGAGILRFKKQAVFDVLFLNIFIFDIYICFQHYLCLCYLGFSFFDVYFTKILEIINSAYNNGNTFVKYYMD